MNGDGNTFRPNDNITREEMAVIIVKAYEYLKKEVRSGNSEFTDKDKISPWAIDFVDKAASTGLIKGVDDGSFASKSSATRAQAVSLIARI